MKTNTKSEQTKQAGLSQRTSESGRAGNGASPAQSGKVGLKNFHSPARAARYIGGTAAYQEHTRQMLAAALSIFGGRVIAVVTE